MQGDQRLALKWTDETRCFGTFWKWSHGITHQRILEFENLAFWRQFQYSSIRLESIHVLILLCPFLNDCINTYLYHWKHNYQNGTKATTNYSNRILNQNQNEARLFTPRCPNMTSTAMSSLRLSECGLGQSELPFLAKRVSLYITLIINE